MPRSTLSTRLNRSFAVLAAGTFATGAMLVGGAATSGAGAAEVHTWERLANCESGQRWHVNTGNGYYGGLQFSDSTWDSYSGPKMKGRADHASKKAQILTAEKVLDAQGWGAWPACSDKLGLGKKAAQGHPYDGKH